MPPVAEAVLAGMVSDNDRQVIGALQGPQRAENRGHVARLVFVHLMQADKGVQEEQAGHSAAYGLGQTLLIDRQIQTHCGCGDDVDG
jgi:hypothetical protein